MEKTLWRNNLLSPLLLMSFLMSNGEMSCLAFVTLVPSSVLL